MIGDAVCVSDAGWLARFEALVQAQQPASTPWTPCTDYSFEARKQIEGIHPQLIRTVFDPDRILDVGCGPEMILVKLLKAEPWRRPVIINGCDPQIPNDEGADIASEENGYVLNGWSADLVICREVLEHLTIRQIRQAVTNLCKLSSKFVYVTTRFAQNPSHLLDVDTADDLDPTHITMLNQSFLRLLFVLEGFTRRADLETRMDWQHKGRCLVYERA
jgi:hypothetical protein